MATLINHVAYSWSMIQLKTTITGDTGGETGYLIDCTAVDWKTSRKMEEIYGLGGQSRSRGFGNVTYSASMEIPYATQEYLRSKSTNGTLMGLGNFDLIVSWCNDLSQNIDAETVTLAECLLTEGGMESKQDDTSITMKFDLHPRRIYTPKALANATWSFELYGKN